MRRYPDTPVVSISVNQATVDTIHVSGTAAYGGWKLDGFLEGRLAAPDQLQDEFDAVIATLAEYVDDASVWTNTATDQPLTPWEAMVLLTRDDEQDEK